MLRFLADLAVFVTLVGTWRWVQTAHCSVTVLVMFATAGLMVVPLVSLLGRISLQHRPTPEQVERIASAVHYSIMLPLGIAIVAAPQCGLAWQSDSCAPIPRSGVGLDFRATP